MRTSRLVRGPSPEEKHRGKFAWTPRALVIAVLIATVVYPAGGGVASGAASMARIGSPAPDFTLWLFNGKTITLSGLKGKPVLVNFWHSG